MLRRADDDAEPKCFMLADQNFLPGLAVEDVRCMAILRVEGTAPRELLNTFRKKFWMGKSYLWWSVLLMCSLSHLGREGPAKVF